MSSEKTYLFTDTFSVDAVNKDGKKFDRVSRIDGHSSNLDMHLTLDINNELISFAVGDSFTMALTNTLLDDDDEATSAAESWRSAIDGPIAQAWSYIMYGKIFKYDQDTNQRVSVYASFGGLLLSLSGDYRHMSSLTVGSYVYILLRR